jgi:hypothetical protein
MIPRRGLLGSAVLGLMGMVMGSGRADGAKVAGVSTDVEQDQLTERGLGRITDAIAQLRLELRTQNQFTELEPIRESQKQFLRANAKLPDFIEVGVDLWFAVHDWHVRWQQPLTLGRDALGRYTVLLNPTTVIMRPDTVANFLGQAYDNK